VKQSVLKRYTPLKSRTKIKRQSPKAKLNEAVWQSIKLARAMFIMAKYGVVLCEYCGRPAWGNELGVMDAHHRDGNHKNSIEENCYIVHRICHEEIKRLHLRVKQLGVEGIKNVDI